MIGLLVVAGSVSVFVWIIFLCLDEGSVIFSVAGTGLLDGLLLFGMVVWLCRAVGNGLRRTPNRATRWVHPTRIGAKTVAPPITLLLQRTRRMAPAPSQKVESARVCARPAVNSPARPRASESSGLVQQGLLAGCAAKQPSRLGDTGFMVKVCNKVKVWQRVESGIALLTQRLKTCRCLSSEIRLRTQTTERLSYLGMATGKRRRQFHSHAWDSRQRKANTSRTSRPLAVATGVTANSRQPCCAASASTLGNSSARHPYSKPWRLAPLVIVSGSSMRVVWRNSFRQSTA